MSEVKILDSVILISPILFIQKNYTIFFEIIEDVFENIFINYILIK